MRVILTKYDDMTWVTEATCPSVRGGDSGCHCWRDGLNHDIVHAAETDHTRKTLMGIPLIRKLSRMEMEWTVPLSAIEGD